MKFISQVKRLLAMKGLRSISPGLRLTTDASLRKLVETGNTWSTDCKITSMWSEFSYSSTPTEVRASPRVKTKSTSSSNARLGRAHETKVCWTPAGCLLLALARSHLRGKNGKLVDSTKSLLEGGLDLQIGMFVVTESLF